MENQVEKEEKILTAQRIGPDQAGAGQLYSSPQSREHYLIGGETLPGKTPAFLADLLSPVGL